MRSISVQGCMKRVILSPRVYLMPFAIAFLLHHLPMIVMYGTLKRPSKLNSCESVENLFRWLDVSLILHAVSIALLSASMTMTLYMRVYRQWYPEFYVLLVLLLVYLGNLAWSVIGIGMPCGNRECSVMTLNTAERRRIGKLEDTSKAICGLQDYDFFWTFTTLCCTVLTSYCCGVHTSDSLDIVEERWMRRCRWLYYLCTFQRAPTIQLDSAQENADTDIFKTLGIMIGRFVVLRYSEKEFVGLSLNDLCFTLNLVAKSQRQERMDQLYPDPEAVVLSSGSSNITSEQMSMLDDDLEYTKRLSNASRPKEEQVLPYTKDWRFHPDIEAQRLQDIAYFGKIAIGIYGWRIFCIYKPFSWFKMFNCRKEKKQLSWKVSHVTEHDNLVSLNRVSFLRYTGIHEDELVYLNCQNHICQTPYAIIKDAERRRLIVCIRGSITFYDCITDGLAQITSMDENEVPDHIPNPSATMTHHGMLVTARKIFGELQRGRQRDLFWNFAKKHCSFVDVDDDHVSDFSGDVTTQAESDMYKPSLEAEPWDIVVCGHSMGAGVGGVLSLLLKRYFPRNVKAFLYAPPMLFDSATAEWCKHFITTCIYGDDLVPRLSMASFFRLEHEMHFHYHRVANERLFRVKYEKKYNLIKYPDTIKRKNSDRKQRAESIRASIPNVSNDSVSRFNPRRYLFGNRTSPPESDSSMEAACGSPNDTGILPHIPIKSKIHSESLKNTRMRSENSVPAAGHNEKMSEASRMDGALEYKMEIDEDEKLSRRAAYAMKIAPSFAIAEEAEKTPIPEVDVPGEIVHVRTRRARKQPWSIFGPREELEYQIVDASAFRRILVTARALQDHLFHHYDSTLDDLVKTYAAPDPDVADSLRDPKTCDLHHFRDEVIDIDYDQQLTSKSEYQRVTENCKMDL